jgi:hypothetical protein
VGKKKLFGDKQGPSIKETRQPKGSGITVQSLTDGTQIIEHAGLIHYTYGANNTPSVADRLNHLFTLNYGNLQAELNRWCIQTPFKEDANGLVDSVTVNLTNLNGITIIEPRDGAVSLKTPSISEVVSPVKITQSNLEAPVVIRQAIPYALAIRCVDEGIDLIKPYIYAMLEKLKAVKGYGPETLTTGRFYATFVRPGLDNSYFREMENYAAFELRLYSDCSKVEVIK